MDTTNTNHRPIFIIAADICRNWSKINFAAKPYLEAMYSLNAVTDKYGWDSASSIIRYFLGNASTWRGESAKRIKAELKTIIK